MKMHKKVLFEKNLPPFLSLIDQFPLIKVAFMMVIHFLSILLEILIHLQLNMNIDSFPHPFSMPVITSFHTPLFLFYFFFFFCLCRAFHYQFLKKLNPFRRFRVLYCMNETDSPDEHLG